MYSGVKVGGLTFYCSAEERTALTLWDAKLHIVLGYLLLLPLAHK